MKTLLYSVLLCALLTSSVAQTPQTNAAGQAEDSAKRLCKVEGQLINLVTGEPVRKGNLSLKPSKSGATTYKANTDNEGKFLIENVEPGQYTLSADRTGFVTQEYGARRPSGPGTILNLAASQHLKELVFKLTPQGIIAGRVLDDEGEPVTGVMVQVLQYRYLSGHKRLIPVTATATSAAGMITNDLGEYRVPNLPPGRYYIAASAQRLTAIQTGPERAAGKDTGEGYIPVYYPNSPDVVAAVPVEVGPGAELRGIDLRLRKGHVVRVSGKVLNAAGAPLRSAVLMVFRREAGGMSVVPVAMSAVQNEKGTFELRDMPPGPYAMLAVSGDPQEMMMTMTSLEVGDQNVEGMVISLGAGQEVPVTAKVEGDSQKIDLSGVRVTLSIEDNPMASLATALLDKENKAVLKRVSADKYKPVISGLPSGAYLKAARFGNQDALVNGMDLRQGAGGALELVVSPAAAEVTGTVANDQGEPMPGAIVTLVPKDPKGRTDLYRTATADQTGSLRIASVVPGEYKLFAWEDIDSGAAEDEEFRKPFESRGVKVSLSEGSKESVRVTAIPRAAVEDEKVRH